MPTWTQQDIDALRAAISSGISKVTYAGPPARSIDYHSLNEMRSLLSEMVRQVGPGRNYRLAKFSKGFRNG